MLPLRDAYPAISDLQTEEHMVDWEPLETLTPDHVHEFMWMFMVEMKSGLRIHAYKHKYTRRYIYLDGEGRVFGWTGKTGMYCEVDPDRMLDLVLNPPRPPDSEVITA